mgnify:FL=1|tara:strand:- start:5371 stop:5586 length:216 start_codon:yes stop_codon:yes gene_type:complete
MNGQEKTKWLQLGVMFENKSGKGYNIILDAVPATDVQSGKIKIMAFEPQEDSKRSWKDNPPSGGVDDEVPF